MTVVWFSNEEHPGELRCAGQTLKSQPRKAEALHYNAWEQSTFYAGKPPQPPYEHRVQIRGLKPGQRYPYTVIQDGETVEAELKTVPRRDGSVRFAAYADCETEPESVGNPTAWPAPGDEKSKRRYLVDQDRGYAANLKCIQERRPDFVVIAGDVVETGGEQRDWDEFWKHNAALGANIPILPAPGNHDYYAGPHDGRFDAAACQRAVNRFTTYFGKTYKKIEYGPVVLLVLDTCNGHPEGSEHDTNLKMDSPTDFNPGSEQYAWLEQELRKAQESGRFTFVTFHFCPLTSGIHGRPVGLKKGGDYLSGQPTRRLLPLFARYGVDVVLNGHDEMYEHSIYENVHVYDVGVGGDGLRGPEPDVPNPHRVFLAHVDAPEVWDEGELVEGGKHYGHLEVNVSGGTATLTPVYLLPKNGGFERRVYDDETTIRNR